MDQYVPKIDGNIYLKFYEATKKRYRGEVHNKLVRENKKTTTGEQQKLKNSRLRSLKRQLVKNANILDKHN